MSDPQAIEDMLRHYLGWPAGHVATYAEAGNLAKSIARMVDGRPWQLSAPDPAPEAAPVEAAPPAEATAAAEPEPAPVTRRPSTKPPAAADDTAPGSRLPRTTKKG